MKSLQMIGGHIMDVIPDLPKSVFSHVEFTCVDFTDLELHQNVFSDCKFSYCKGIPKGKTFRVNHSEVVDSEIFAGYGLGNNLFHMCHIKNHPDHQHVCESY